MESGPRKRLRSGSYNKDKDEGFASCIPRVPAVSASAGALSVPGLPLAAMPPPAYFPPHYPAHAATTMAMDMDASASASIQRASPALATATSDSDDEQERSSVSSSSGSESDTEFATELLGPGELERGFTFDEACRMLLDTGGDDDAEDDVAEATGSPDGPCPLDW